MRLEVFLIQTDRSLWDLDSNKMSNTAFIVYNELLVRVKYSLQRNTNEEQN